VKINQLFGVTHGLSMGFITFDWGQIIAFTDSPFLYPWWTAANVALAIVLFYWILLPIVYVSPHFVSDSSHLTISVQYSNLWYSAYIPLVSSQIFDNTGNVYNFSRVINTDGSFNLQAYKTYSPLFLPASFSISYGLGFASITALVMHTLLINSKRIWIHAHPSFQEQPDIHARMMSVYKAVPDSWYLLVFRACNNTEAKTCLFV
jgi:hypothetical protein